MGPSSFTILNTLITKAKSSDESIGFRDCPQTWKTPKMVVDTGQRIDRSVFSIRVLDPAIHMNVLV